MLKRFGTCELDLASRELRRQGRPVRLSPKAFQLLKLLIERAPAAVSKQEIHAIVWPGTFVSDASLTNVVSEIRARIGDSARKPALVRTLHGFGYAFAGTSRDAKTGETATSVCRVVLGSRRVVLSAGVNLIGRDAEAAVLIDHASVSRRHARIVLTGNVAVLEDLESRNGTFVNGQRIKSPTELRDGDVIGLGSVAVIVEKASTAESTKTDLV
jgi:DNA-binding winged helix-turn-helix (wHTH) protein